MTIQITQPEVEAIIRQRLDTGSFKDAEDVILQALRSSPNAPALRLVGKALSISSQKFVAWPMISISVAIEPIKVLNCHFSLAAAPCLDLLPNSGIIRHIKDRLHLSMLNDFSRAIHSDSFVSWITRVKSRRRIS